MALVNTRQRNRRANGRCVNAHRTLFEEGSEALVERAEQGDRVRVGIRPLGKSAREGKQEMKRIIISLGAAVAATMLFVGPAGASVSIPDPIPVSAGQTDVPITITYSGMPVNQRIFFIVCDKDPSDPTFQWSLECTTTTEHSINPVANTTGSGTFAMSIFHGPEQSGDLLWGCFAPGETPPSGYTAAPCYIRVTPDQETNNALSQSSPIHFTLQGTPVPESPLVILLPIVAGMVLIGAFVINRRRSGNAPGGPQSSAAAA
jgi:hypothetical protein